MSILGESFTAAGYLAGAAVFWLEMRRKKTNTEGMAILAAVGFLSGTFGAKISQLIFQGASFDAFFRPELGGRAVFGGVLFGWLGVEIAKRIMGIKRSLGDAFALALPVGEGIGRIGCLINGCCYGRECKGLPWAIFQHEAWRHPSQIYSFIGCAAIASVVFVLREKPQWKDKLFMLYLGLFGLARFIVEFFREPSFGFFGLSVMQWICIELMVSSVIVLWIKFRRDGQLELQGE